MISVLMPVHNNLQFLEESIKSILNQTYGDFELLIMDDGSTESFSDFMLTLDSEEQKITLLRLVSVGAMVPLAILALVYKSFVKNILIYFHILGFCGQFSSLRIYLVWFEVFLGLLQ